MPPQFEFTPDMYPERGWSNAYGQRWQLGWPWGAPYAFTMQTENSTGRFEALNDGIQFHIIDSIGLDILVYDSGVTFAGSDFPCFMILTNAATKSEVRFGMRWWTTVVPPITYWGDTDIAWLNPREGVTVQSGQWFPLPLTGSIDTTVDLTPWNRGAFEKYF